MLQLWRILKGLKLREKWAMWGAFLLGMCVPVQILSQTWDDHDRSGRTATRDVALNYLETLDPGAIVFTPDDNSIFPMWYITEVEDPSRGITVVPTPYLGTDWYPAQLQRAGRAGQRVPLTAPDALTATGGISYVRVSSDTLEWREAVPALRNFYTQILSSGDQTSYRVLRTPLLYFVQEGDTIRVDMRKTGGSLVKGSEIITLDMLATNAAREKPRPVWWASRSGDGMLGGQLKKHLESVGPLSRFSPSRPGFNAARTADLALHAWNYGGVVPGEDAPYFDPLTASQVIGWRQAAIRAAVALVDSAPQTSLALLERLEREAPASALPYDAYPLTDHVPGVKMEPEGKNTFVDEGVMIALTYQRLGEVLKRPDLVSRGREMAAGRLGELRQVAEYVTALRPQYRKFVTYRVGRLLAAYRTHRR